MEIVPNYLLLIYALLIKQTNHLAFCNAIIIKRLPYYLGVYEVVVAVW